MLKERLAAAHAVQSTFLAAERAQDTAAVETAKCLATALEARQLANLPLGTGLKAIGLMARSTALAVEARQSLIEAHPELAAIPSQIGLEHIKAWGPTSDDCVPVEPRGQEVAPPRLAVAA